MTIIKNYHIVNTLLDDIVSFTEKYKEYIRDLKNDGYVILGYCRKSKTRESKFTVTRSLQLMATGLRRRSLVQTLFVTVSCNASTSMHKRDTKKNKILQVLSVVAGNAQGILLNTIFHFTVNIDCFLDLLKDLVQAEKSCLIIADSAGLTTYMEDVRLLIRYAAYYSKKNND